MSHKDAPPQYTAPELLDEQSWDDLLTGKSVKDLDPFVLETIEQLRTEVFWQKAMREADADKKNDVKPIDELSRRRAWKMIQAVQDEGQQIKQQGRLQSQQVGQMPAKHRLKLQWGQQHWFTLAASVAVIGVALSLVLNITHLQNIDLEDEGYVERSTGQIVLPLERQADDPRQAATALMERLAELGFSAVLEEGSVNELGVVYVVITDPLGISERHQIALQELGVRLVTEERRGIIRFSQ